MTLSRVYSVPAEASGKGQAAAGRSQRLPGTYLDMVLMALGHLVCREGGLQGASGGRP